MQSLQFTLLSLVWNGLVHAQQNTTPLNAPSLPIAVRGPYFNVWFPQGKRSTTANNVWMTTWTTSGSTGWFAAVKVDGTTYRVLGRDGSNDTLVAVQTAASFTPTRTSFLFECGAVEVNATFLSPVEPENLVRQSLPFSYFYMSARSTDGNVHDIKMYSEVSAELSSGDENQIATWTAHVDASYVILQTQIQNARSFNEVEDHAQDAVEFFCMKASPNTSWQISINEIAWDAFADSSLSNTADPSSSFRPVSQHTVFGIAIEFGNVTITPQPATWTYGIVRDPSIQYMAENGKVELRRSYYQSAFDSTLNAVRNFIDTFDNALSSAIALDARVITDGRRYSPEYADLLALALRQAMGAMEITISQTSSGAWNSTDIKAFFKNMGSVGSTKGVNAVDVLYAAFPVYLYLYPDLGGYFLKPLLEYQDSSMYHLPYAALNIGSSFPNATADDTDQPHQYGVEQSANMIIMTLAQAQASGNGTLMSSHYNLLRIWTEYLIANTLTPNNQLSPDKSSLSNNNQTNVALKGVIAIAAMAKISNYLGVKEDFDKYNNTAYLYIQQWKTFAVSADSSHLMMIYGQQGSSGLMYNLYADKLLQLNLVPDEVYEIYTTSLSSASRLNRLGIPSDSDDPQMSRVDWMMLSAATLTNFTTRDLMISQLHSYASANLSGSPWCVSYDPTSGACLGGQNSPAIGAVFALLALNQTIKPISFPPEGGESPVQSASHSRKFNASGAIAGGLAGGLAIVLTFVTILLILRRHRRMVPRRSHTESEVFYPYQSGSQHPILVVEKDNEVKHPLPLRNEDSFPIGTLRCTPVESQVRDLLPHPSMSDLGAQVVLDTQMLMNNELRSEVENLRRDLEQMRTERAEELAPPRYS